jgi:hypothetical protein
MISHWGFWQWLILSILALGIFIKMYVIVTENDSARRKDIFSILMRDLVILLGTYFGGFYG